MMQKVLSGRYELLDPLGAGGMAVVHKAYDRETGRIVAIKVLRDELSLDREFINRFNREARAASKLDQENIVHVYDVGQDGDVRYIVMEHVRGSTLKDMIREYGRIETNEAIRMALGILAALDRAHRNHIIHRDIKPQNILVNERGTVKVTDFGIARLTNGETQTYYTRDKNVLGSVHYFSPEQASGNLADEKSDLYSVGVVLFEMLTGQVLFDGDTPVAVALKHVQERPRSALEIAPDNVTKALDEVLQKALDKDAAHRYQTAREFANDLREAYKRPRGGFVKRRPDPEEGKEREQRKYRLLRIRNIALLALLGAVIAAAILIYGEVSGRDRIILPNFALMTMDDAAKRIADLGLDCVIEERHSDDVRMGAVISQYPEASTPVDSGDRIWLVISKGKEKFMMPKLLELTRAEAVEVIEQNELVLTDDNVVLEISDAPPGVVVAQIPAVNEWVKPGDIVTLRVSGESNFVPNVIGLSPEEATAKLAALGYKTEIYEKYSDSEDRSVVEQNPAAETRQLLGTTVTLTVPTYVPQTYHAQLALDLSIPEGGAHVICTLEEDGEEREVLNEHLEESRTIRLDMYAYTPGLHTVRVYRGDKLLVETRVEFAETAAGEGEE